MLDQHVIWTDWIQFGRLARFDVLIPGARDACIAHDANQ
jgi:hypothetical protein